MVLFRSIAGFALIGMSATLPARAQWQNAGMLAGRVLDLDGAPVAAAKLAVEALDSGTTYELTSDASGSFRLEELAPGAYRIEVDADGFAPWSAAEVQVSPGGEREVAPRLEMLSARGRQRVSVGAASGSAGQPVSGRTNADAGTESERESRTPVVAPVVHATVTVATSTSTVHAQIAERPLAEAKLAQWAAFVPLPGQAVRGEQSRDETFVSDLVTHVALRPSASDNGAALVAAFAPSTAPSTTAPAELRLGTAEDAGAAASAGDASGATEAALLFKPTEEPGTSAAAETVTVRRSARQERLHGELFAEDRDASWGAANAFTDVTTQTSDGTFVSTPYRPPDQRLQAGLQMGGPIREGRGNWFIAVDQLHRNFPGLAVASEPAKFFAAPNAEQIATLQGRLQAGTPGVLNSGQAAALYSQTMGQLSGLLGPVQRSSDQTIAFPRFDWKLGERNRTSLDYDFIRLDSANGVQSQVTDTWGIGSFGTRELELNGITARLDSFFTSNLLNELRFAYTHDAESEIALAPTTFEQQFAHNFLGAPPQIGVASGSGGFKFGTPSTLNRPAYPDEQREQASDTLTWMKGRHEFRAGYDLQYVRDLVSGLNYGNGAYTYSTSEAFVADLLSPNHCDASSTGTGNLPCWSTYRQTVGPNSFRFDTADYAGFGSDTWKVRHDVTLSLGVRYDREHLPHPNAALVNPEIPETAALPTSGDFAPRAGFGWALPDHGATVLRAGFGFFYGRIANASLLSALSQTGTASAVRSYLFKPLDIGAAPFPYVFGAQPNLQIAPDVNYFASGFEHPRAEQAQFSVEQALSRDTHVTVSYLGSFGTALPRIVDENIDLNSVGTIEYTVDDPSGLGPLHGSYASRFYYQRLNPRYQQLAAIESTATARYQAVGVMFDTRTTRAVQMHLDFRYGHAVDDNPFESEYSGQWNVLDPANLALEHGTSNADIRDRIAGGLVLHEPWRAHGVAEKFAGGYTLTTTGSLHTGMPYTMRTTGSVPSFACSYQQWLQNGNDCVLHSQAGVITGVPVTIGALGASMNGAGGGDWLPAVGRNTYRYPMNWNADVRLGKRTAISRKTDFEAAAEMFNAFNHENVTHMETVGYLASGVTADTGAGRLTYLSGANGTSQFGAVTSANSNDLYRDRQIQIILRFIF